MQFIFSFLTMLKRRPKIDLWRLSKCSAHQSRWKFGPMIVLYDLHNKTSFVFLVFGVSSVFPSILTAACDNAGKFLMNASTLHRMIQILKRDNLVRLKYWIADCHSQSLNNQNLILEGFLISSNRDQGFSWYCGRGNACPTTKLKVLFFWPNQCSYK